MRRPTLRRLVGFSPMRMRSIAKEGSEIEIGGHEPEAEE